MAMREEERGWASGQQCSPLAPSRVERLQGEVAPKQKPLRGSAGNCIILAR